MVLVAISAAAAFCQLLFDIFQTIKMRSEHRARLADEKRLTADELRLANDELRMDLQDHLRDQEC
jgi:hypothetical protein